MTTENRSEDGSQTSEYPTAKSGLQRPGLQRRCGAILVGIFIGAMLLAGAVRVYQWQNRPELYFLVDQPGAQWIRADRPFLLHSLDPRKPEEVVFDYWFSTAQEVRDAQITYRAFRSCTIELDERKIHEGKAPLDQWRQPVQVRIPEVVSAGSHHLVVTVTNYGAWPCLWLRSEQLKLQSSHDWSAATDRVMFNPVLTLSEYRWPDWAGFYSPVSSSFAACAVWLAVLFAVVFLSTLWNGRPPGVATRIPRWSPTSRQVRYLLMFLWVAMAANNLWRLPTDLGYDISYHLDYVRFVAQRHALPLATDGWQMFQSPLFYVLAAPLFAAFSPFLDDAGLTKALRVLPLLCGLAQLEIVYRTARLVFAKNSDLQILAVILGGLLPMHIYSSQVIGNEPLCGCLTALLLLLCMKLLIEPGEVRRPAYFAIMGVVFGLALLSKVTPVLLTPLVLGAIVVHGCRRSDAFGAITGRAALAMVSCLIVAGWYFARNWIELGRPFVGGWDPVHGRAWWQDPSYRTWEQLTSFGQALKQPMYTGCWSLWDSLYSTLWLDGFNQGALRKPELLPWNVDWMIAGAWLGLVPTSLLILSVASLWRREFREVRAVLVFALVVIATYLAAIIDLFVQLPIYSTAKATYMLGATPCLAILAAAGAAPFLKFRLTRALVFALIVCWAAAAYLAYFPLHG